MIHPGILEITRRDPRYPHEAYEFLFESLRHTQLMLNRVPPENLQEPAGEEYHVSGAELVHGMIDLANQQFGRLSRCVFRLWGIDATDDIGEIVFNLIEGNLLSRTDRDCKDDFHDICDLDDAMLGRFEIVLGEAE